MTESAREFVKLSVSLPRMAAENLRAAVTAGAASSVSAYVAAAIEDRLARDRTLERISELRDGRPFSAEALAWARSALGVTGPGGQQAS